MSRNHLRTIAVAASTALVSAALLTGCSDNTTPTTEKPTGPNVVTVSNMTYSPANVTVNAGETVTWYFDDPGVAHNVIGTGNASSLLRSPMIGSGVYSQTFDQPGTYNYFCSVHPDMMGSVIVR